mgnify:CR=1 FL=1
MSNPIFTIEMENGMTMKGELYPEIAPNSVANFVALANKGFYQSCRIMSGGDQKTAKAYFHNMPGNYGARIGQVLLKSYGEEVHVRAKAWAAAASDARMNGCSLPVVINSGSGNQGITCSVPVLIYAEELGVSDEMKLRALTVSNLITTHLKTGIGRLSAYCGAISAGVGAGAGITYLYGGKHKEIAHTIVNALAIDSGIICDGAKSSCAAKIATSIDALAVGVTFAAMDIGSKIVFAVIFIGVVTFLLSAIGVKIGNLFGMKFKSKAELFGGVVLVLMGLKIFLEDLGYLDLPF